MGCQQTGGYTGVSVYRWIYLGVSIQVDRMGCQCTGGHTGVSVYR